MKKVIYIYIFAVFCGCSPVKNLEKPDISLPESFIFEQKSDYLLSQNMDTIWWRNFGDTVLNNLVSEALMNNRDLKTALSNIEISRRKIFITRSAMLPSFDAEISVGASYDALTKIEQSYVVTPTMSWQMNLAGADQNKVAQARFGYLSELEEYENTESSLIYEVISNYISVLEYKSSLELAEETFRVRSESVALIDSLVNYGLASGLDLEQARALVATAAVAVPKYKRSLEESVLALAVLLNRAELSVERFEDCDIKRLKIIPVSAGVPSELLTERTDLRVAMYELESARSGVKVAHSARFPSFSLTADGGISSNVLKNLVNGNPGVWSATVSLLQPIFAFGKYKNNEKIAIEQYNKALYNYEKSVITAFKEVETSLLSVETYGKQLEKTLDVVAANRKAVLMSSGLYEMGLNSYIYQLDAQRELFSAEQSYIQLYAAKIMSYISLYKALNII